MWSCLELLPAGEILIWFDFLLLLLVRLLEVRGSWLAAMSTRHKSGGGCCITWKKQNKNVYIALPSVRNCLKPFDFKNLILPFFLFSFFAVNTSDRFHCSTKMSSQRRSKWRRPNCFLHFQHDESFIHTLCLKMFFFFFYLKIVVDLSLNVFILIFLFFFASFFPFFIFFFCLHTVQRDQNHFWFFSPSCVQLLKILFIISPDFFFGRETGHDPPDTCLLLRILLIIIILLVFFCSQPVLTQCVICFMSWIYNYTDVSPKLFFSLLHFRHIIGILLPIYFSPPGTNWGSQDETNQFFNFSLILTFFPSSPTRLFEFL